MLEVVKQGTTSKGYVWLLGRVNLGGLVIQDIFSTNLREEIQDTTKPIKIKQIVMRRRQEDNSIRFYVEL